MDREAASLMIQSKSPGIAIMLTVLFGGFGLFYSSVLGGVLMSVCMVIGVAFTLLTLGFGVVVLVPVWMASIIWAVIATSSHNKKLVQRSLSQGLVLLGALLLLSGCGGGGGSDPSPATKPRIIVVNQVPGLTVLGVQIAAFEEGSRINEYGTLTQVLAVDEGFFRVLDQANVDELFATIPGVSQVGMDTLLPHNLGSARFDLRWTPGEGDFIVEVVANPDPNPAPGELFTVRRMTIEEYEVLLSTGQIQEIVR